jgi:hypothetical protein
LEGAQEEAPGVPVRARRGLLEEPLQRPPHLFRCDRTEMHGTFAGERNTRNTASGQKYV